MDLSILIKKGYFSPKVDLLVVESILNKTTTMTNKQISRYLLKYYTGDKKPSARKWIYHLRLLTERCPVCNGVKNSLEAKTCGYSCSNTFFRKGRDHPNYKGNNYRTICFDSHKKCCVICEENKIVEVHHLDENNTNNSPENLIPLCPTHHKYWHSRYKYLIEDQVLQYQKEFLSKTECSSDW